MPCVLVPIFFGLANAPKFSFGNLATAGKAKEQEHEKEKGKEECCPGCRGCNDDFVFREVKDTNFSQFDDNPLPLVPPPKVDMTQHNDLSKDSKKSTQPTPFSLNSSAGGNGFGFGAAIAAATANTTPNNSTQPAGLFFGNSSFKFNTTASTPEGAGGVSDNKNGSLFGGNVNKPTITSATPTSSAESIKPAFSFNSSTLFGGSKCMYQLLNHFVNDFIDFILLFVGKI